MTKKEIQDVITTCHRVADSSLGGTDQERLAALIYVRNTLEDLLDGN